MVIVAGVAGTGVEELGGGGVTGGGGVSPLM